MEPKVAVVGTGRHGSGFVAAVLCAADVACGHEAWWNPIDTHAVDLDADSSFCAVPDWGPYLTVRDRLVTRPTQSVPSVAYAAETWVRWTSATMRLDVDATWALDEIIGDPATFAKVVAGLADTDVDLPDVWPGRTNAHNVAGLEVGLDDLPVRLRDDVAELALDWGYEL